MCGACASPKNKRCSARSLHQETIGQKCSGISWGLLAVGQEAYLLSSCTLTLLCLAACCLQPRCPPIRLLLEPSRGSLAPSASCTTAVTVTSSCTGNHMLLLQVSSSGSSSSGGTKRSDQGQQPIHKQQHYVQVLVTVSEPCVMLDTYK